MNPRIRLLTKIGGEFEVYEVDGNLIRKSTPDFTNFGQHYRFPDLIPRNEFFIDQEEHPNETPFYIHHMLVEWRLMASGVPYNRALEIADRAERAERAKALERMERKGAPAERFKLRFVGSTPSGKKVWIVDGKAVRDMLYVDFTEGGHWLVYGWIPEDEIWIDDDVQPRERALILLHELLEARLMSKGLPYDKAHAKATDAEWWARWLLPDRPPISRRAAEVWLCPICGKASSMPCGCAEDEEGAERIALSTRAAASDRISKWIEENVSDPRNHCFFYAAALAALFPGLTLVKGWNTGQFRDGALIEEKDTGHFWVEDEKGRIIDPTAGQYPKGRNFGGAPVSLAGNLDEVVKDPLFKTLSADDQEKILAKSADPVSGRFIGFRRYTALLPLSKRAAAVVGEEAYWRIAHDLVEKGRSEFGRRFFAWQADPAGVSGRRLVAKPPASVRQYLDQRLPKDVIVREIEGDEGVFELVPRKFTAPEPVLGRWMHVVNVEIPNLKAFLPRFMQLHGEVCFSSTIGTHTAFMSGGDFLAVVVDGPARTAFGNDVWSDFDPWTGRRYIPGKSPVLRQTSEGAQESWVVPNETKLVGVLTNSPEYAQEAKEMGVPVFGSGPFGDHEPEEEPAPKEWEQAGKHPLGEGWESAAASRPPISKRAGIKALSVRQPWASMIADGRKTIETRKWATGYRGPLLIVSSAKPAIEPAGQALAIADLVDCRPMTKDDEQAAGCATYPSAQAWVLENIRKITPFPVRGALGLFEVEMPEHSAAAYLPLFKRAMLPFSKRKLRSRR